MSHTAELPTVVDPYKLADQDGVVEGILPLTTLERLHPLLLDSDATAEVCLRFGRDEENRRVVSGTLSALVKVECQRCLEPMMYPVTSEFKLGLVLSDEQAAQLPRQLEPLLIEEREMDVWRVIEDELLLSLPAFPLHSESECVKAPVVEPSPQEPVAAKENPFRVLRGFRASGSDKDISDT